MLEELSSSSIKETIINNRQCFDAGFVATDVTVFYYYMAQAKYEATHSWAFQEECMRLATTDCERSFCYGVAAHLLQDSVAHNHYVPGKITQYYLPNYIIHPLSEAKIEAHIIKDYPSSYTRVQHSLRPLLNDPILMDKFQQAVSKLVVLDVEYETKRFDNVLGDPEGFYTKAFHLPDIYKTVAYGNRTYGIIFIALAGGLFALALWKKKRFFLIVPVFIGLIGGFLLIGGIAGFTNIEEFNQMMDMNIDRSTNTFTPSGWMNRYQYDPTGFAKLRYADSQIWWMWGLIGGGLIFILIIYAYVKMRKRI